MIWRGWSVVDGREAISWERCLTTDGPVFPVAPITKMHEGEDEDINVNWFCF